MRIRAAGLFAQLAVRPATAKQMVALARHAPALLTLGARLGGKAQPLRGLSVGIHP